ncbi:NYN domain-containing protein [Pseudomonas sp. PDM20]|uniref:NYN domain-containing protein n=1 Tax=Pseudomonas sp. PDM20 TaxID=2769254 RepID=UPI00177A89CD|nr:NYN domain-containing protein [Pseudomonas sp. PDM20]MBD9682317.1 NYN domain-containing protein [Pseudomonas sp. PDM20]
MSTAILVDGAYFIKRFRQIEPDNAYDAERAADLVHRWATAHLVPSMRPAQNGVPRTDTLPRRELYRIFFYDCPPLLLKHHNPISKLAIDFSRSREATFRVELHNQLRSKRKLALRLGHLSKDVRWTIKPDRIAQLLRGQLQISDLTPDDVRIDTKQKGVDMRIGIDVASLAFKQHVDQIVLFAGDADFVPAAKMARREGIDFILDPMWQSIPDGLMEHIDGLRSTCPKPAPRRTAFSGATT